MKRRSQRNSKCKRSTRRCVPLSTSSFSHLATFTCLMLKQCKLRYQSWMLLMLVISTLKYWFSCSFVICIPNIFVRILLLLVTSLKLTAMKLGENWMSRLLKSFPPLKFAKNLMKASTQHYCGLKTTRGPIHLPFLPIS